MNEERKEELVEGLSEGKEFARADSTAASGNDVKVHGHPLFENAWTRIYSPQM
jgi:hypothetical protein